MEDALFNMLLFMGFYCLYSKMFAPTRQAVAVVTPAAVQQTTPAVETKTAIAATTPIASVATKPAAVNTTTGNSTVETGMLSESAHDLESDQDREATVLTLDVKPDQESGTATTATLRFTSNAAPGRTGKQSTTTRSTKSRQLGKQTAIASSNGSESRR